jgi:hypothetical protein
MEQSTRNVIICKINLFSFTVRNQIPRVYYLLSSFQKCSTQLNFAQWCASLRKMVFPRKRLRTLGILSPFQLQKENKVSLLNNIFS